jgi:hypothetical protein
MVIIVSLSPHHHNFSPIFCVADKFRHSFCLLKLIIGYGNSTRRGYMKRRSTMFGLILVLLLSMASPGLAQTYKPHLQKVGFSNLDASPGGNTEFAVQEDVGYIGSLGGEGIKVVDVSDPNNPQFLRNISIEGVSTMDLKVQADPNSDLRNVLAASTQGSDTDKAGFYLFDISNPKQPVEKSFTKLENGVHNLFVHGDYLYATRGGSGMAIYNISDLSNPVKVAHFALDEGDIDHDDEGEVHDHFIYLHDIFVQTNGDKTYAYLAYWDAGARIVDVTNPENPVEAGKYEYPTGSAHYAEPTPNGNYLLVGDEVACGEPGGIHVLDIRDLGDINQSSFWAPPEVNAEQCAASQNANDESQANNANSHAYAWTGHNFSVEDNLVYQGGYKTGVNVIDISDPASPETIAKYRNTATIGEEKKNKNTTVYDERPFYWSAVPYKGHIYAPDIDAGLLVLDLQEQN